MDIKAGGFMGALAGKAEKTVISNINAKYNNVYVFNKLDCINEIRNRIAHHEPICFGKYENIDTQYVSRCYDSMARLFQWMNINSESLLYGLDHVKNVLDTIKIINFFQKRIACKKKLYLCSVKSRQSLKIQTAG